MISFKCDYSLVITPVTHFLLGFTTLPSIIFSDPERKCDLGSLNEGFIMRAFRHLVYFTTEHIACLLARPSHALH